MRFKAHSPPKRYHAPSYVDTPQSERNEYSDLIVNRAQEKPLTFMNSFASSR